MLHDPSVVVNDNDGLSRGNHVTDDVLQVDQVAVLMLTSYKKE